MGRRILTVREVFLRREALFIFCAGRQRSLAMVVRAMLAVCVPRRREAWEFGA